MTEGHLYCDHCGEEIRIVPDFEPEIEREMTETLSTLFVELAEETALELSDNGLKSGRAESGRGKESGWQTKESRGEDRGTEDGSQKKPEEKGLIGKKARPGKKEGERY